MAQPVYEPYIHNQTASSSEWTIVHNWGRAVSFTVYNGINGQGHEIEVEYEWINDNSFKVKINRALIGSVVVS